jgi:hypothetical protein
MRSTGSGTPAAPTGYIWPISTRTAAHSSSILRSPVNARRCLPSPQLANGHLEALYDTFSGGQFHVHLENITNHGGGFFTINSDQDIYDFTPPSLSSVGARDRELGDYQYIMSIGDTYYGTFAGLGDPRWQRQHHFADRPVLVTGSDVPEPATLAFAATAIAGMLFLRRGRRLAK